MLFQLALYLLLNNFKLAQISKKCKYIVMFADLYLNLIRYHNSEYIIKINFKKRKSIYY